MDEKFIKQIVQMRGDSGMQWIENIPSLITKYEKQWDLVVEPPYQLSCNYVAPAKRADGTPVVLKMRFPQDKEFPNEFHALRIFDGNGAVKLLEVDEENAVMLLEKVVPGTMLNTVRDDTTMIAHFVEIADAMHKHQENVSNFQTITDWGKWFTKFQKDHNGFGPFPKQLFEQAESIFLEYDASTATQYLLHGDLYRDNILLSKRGWLTIDPRGILGEREFETAIILFSPDYEPELAKKEIISRRAKQLAEKLNLDEQKILRWALAKSVLTALWLTYDYDRISNIDIENATVVSELLY